MNYNPINSSHNSLGWVKFTFLLFLWIFVGFVNKAVGQEAYVVLNDKVLTFYYDTQRASRTGTTYGINDLSSDYPAWLDVEYRNGSYYPRNEITKVIFDASFANYKPKTCSRWFYRCSTLTEIQDIEKYLKTDEVTSMSSMFSDCKSLESLDVTKFNTANVTNMVGMFAGCRSLTTLDVTNFNTAKVTNMNSMFSQCHSLTTLDVSKFNTENVMNMGYMFSFCHSLSSLDVTKFNTANVMVMSEMFRGCSGLTSLDVTKFNTANVTYMSYMFVGCSGLTTILVDANKWSTDQVITSTDMFNSCYQIIGDKGTTFNSSKIEMEYAHVDGGESNPGYLTTGKYKIFYNGIDDDENTLDTYSDAVTEFMGESVTLKEPVKAGFIFTGWTPITGLPETTPTKNVTIPADAVGNRIYTAHWVPKQSVVLSVDIDDWSYGRQHTKHTYC